MTPWRICVSPRGLWNILNFHFALPSGPLRIRSTFFRDFCTITNRNPTALIGCGNSKKKIAQLDQPIPLEYWWILQIVFPAYRFVWSKCSTNNSILNAIDRLKKVAAIFILTRTPHFDSPKSNGWQTKKKNTHSGTISSCSYYFSHFNSWFKYSKYLDSQQPNTMYRYLHSENQLHLCRWIGSYDVRLCMQYTACFSAQRKVIDSYGYYYCWYYVNKLLW